MPDNHESEPKRIMAIKGFNADMTCRGFQFETGKEYRHEGTVAACKSGFHSVTGHPLAVFNHYAPAGSVFCRVEIGGATSDDGDKTASEIIRVGEEIGISGLVKEAVEWVNSRSRHEGETATGYQGAASATGDRGAASATGDQGAAMASGYGGKVSGATGNALFAVERGEWDGKSYPIISVACGIAGHDGIEPDVFYVAKGGKLVKEEGRS